MRLKLSIVFIALLLLSFCSENVKDSNPLTTVDEIYGETANEIIDETVVPATDDIREMNSLQKSDNSSETDTSLYAIHIRDRYSDLIYLNSVANATYYSNMYGNYYSYHGVFVHNSIEYSAAAIYHADTKTLACTLYYIDDQTMVYNTRILSKNFFGGTYTWACSGNEYYYRQYCMYCTVTKGEFPGMNDGL